MTTADAYIGAIMRMSVLYPEYQPVIEDRLSQIVQELERHKRERPSRSSSSNADCEYKATRAWELLVETATRLEVPHSMYWFRNIATVLEQRYNLHVPRSAKRKKSCLVMWFQDHLEEAEASLPHIEPDQKLEYVDYSYDSGQESGQESGSEDIVYGDIMLNE